MIRGIVAAVLSLAMPSGLTWAEPDRGREIYHGRATDAGKALIGTGNFAVPIAQASCDRCHGRDGRGRTEAGVRAPRIDGVALFAQGASRPAYDAASLRAALTSGIGLAGKPFHPSMPRFDMSPADHSALAEYLGRLAIDAKDGITSDAITLAIPYPPGRLTLAERVKKAADDVATRLGRPHGRSIVFELIEWGARAPLGRRLIEVRPAAFVLSLMIDNSEVLSVSRARLLPLLMPMFSLEEGIDVRDARSHMPSREAQFRALSNAAGADAAIVADASARRWIESRKLAEGRPILEAGQVTSTHRKLIVVGGKRPPPVDVNRADLRIFALADDTIGWPKNWSEGRVIVSDPRLSSANGEADFDVSLRVGVELLVEGLLRAGRDLTTAGLIDAIDGVVFERPYWQRLDYGRFKSHGQSEPGTRPFR